MVDHSKTKNPNALIDMIIIRSPDGEDGWTLVKPEDVPSWIKNDDQMITLLANGTAVSLPETGDTNWYQRYDPDAVARAKRLEEEKTKPKIIIH